MLDLSNNGIGDHGEDTLAICLLRICLRLCLHLRLRLRLCLCLRLRPMRLCLCLVLRLRLMRLCLCLRLCLGPGLCPRLGPGLPRPRPIEPRLKPVLTPTPTSGTHAYACPCAYACACAYLCLRPRSDICLRLRLAMRTPMRTPALMPMPALIHPSISSPHVQLHAPDPYPSPLF